MSKKYTKEQLLNLLKDYLDKNGIPINRKHIFLSKNKLPSYTTYVKYFGNNLANIIKLTGYQITQDEIIDINTRGTQKYFTKNEVIDIILQMQLKLNRPLMYDDFRNPQPEEIGITYIKHFFGTMNKMKQELGLEIIQDSMVDLHITKEEFIKHIDEITKMFYKEYKTRKIPTEYFNQLKNHRNYITYWKLCKKYFNVPLRDYLQTLGFNLEKCGQGHSFYYNDGEVAVSQHEKIFSDYLRNDLGLEYNKDYFRNKKYSRFINDYNGLMNCDYIIKLNSREIYIEVAGFLRDYKSYFIENRKIKAKDKEDYRLKLNIKDNMLKTNNLEHYILFPDELNKMYLDNIFMSKEVS